MAAGGRIRLAVDARMVEHSGIGTCIKNIVPFLADAIDLITLGDAGKLERFPWFDRARHVALRAPIYGLAEQIELARRVPACDVLWSPHYNVPLLPVRARRRMVTIHDVFHLAHASTLSLPKRLYARLIMRGAVRLSHAVLTVSRFSREEILRHVPSARDATVEVIPNGRDPGFAESFSPRSEPGRYLLFVGNVKPHKNLKGALRAFAAVAAEYPDLRFRIVGRREGFLTGDAEAVRAAEGAFRDRVEFTGHVSDRELKDHYGNAAALVFPSFYEGFGLPILEAMAFGIPIISSNRASMPEVGGDAILYFDPDAEEGLAARIRDVLEGRWRPDPSKYRERLELFSWSACAGRYLAVVERLAA